MGTNLTAGNLFVLMAGISTSVIHGEEYSSNSFIPEYEPRMKVEKSLIEWKDESMADWSGYYMRSNEEFQFTILLDFVQKLQSDTTDIDPEFIDIVDEEFWDLL